MAGVVIEFLRQFFGAREVVIEDLTVELTEAGLSQASYAELDEGLTLLAGEASPEQQQLIEASRAQLASAVTGQPGAAADITMAEVHMRLGQMGVVPVGDPAEPSSDGDLPPGVTVSSSAPEAAQAVDDSAAAIPSPPAPTPAESSSSSDSSSSGSSGAESDSSGSSGSSGSPDSGSGGHAPPYPGGNDSHYPPPHQDDDGHYPPPHQDDDGHYPPPHHDDDGHYPPPHQDDDGHYPPPTNGEHHDDHQPPPPPNGEYPDYWAGYEVAYHDTGYPVVLIGDVQVRLLPDGDGGYYAAHGAYRLAETDDGGLAWDPEGPLVLPVSHLTDTGVVVPLATDVSVTFQPDYITWENVNGPSPVAFDSSYTFQGIDNGELYMLHDEYGYYHVISPAGVPRFIDPETGSIYESVDAYLESQGYDQDDNGEVDPGDGYPDDNGEPVENGEVPPEWAGYETHYHDDGYYYVEAGGRQLRLEPNGAGGYHVDHGDYRLVEVDGAMVWTNPPYGYTHPVSEVTPTGIVVPLAADVVVRVEPDQISWENDAGASVTFGSQWDFYGVEAGELVMRHTEQGFDYLIAADGNGRYRDPETGEYYDSYGDLQEALAENADDMVDPGDVDDNGDGPDDWAGYDAQYHDDGYYYVEVDGVELRLEPNGAGGYHVDHGDYRLVEIDGAMVWTNPPFGYTYPVSEVTATGIVLPAAADVEVRIEPNQVVWERDTGAGSSSVTFGADWIFAGIENGELAMRHAEQGFDYLVAPDGSSRYHDPRTGEYYDSYGDLQEALTATDVSDMVDPDNGDQGDADDPGQNGVGPAEWAGYDTTYDNGYYYVEIDGVQLQLQPDGNGGYYADHHGYRLEDHPEGPVWRDNPTGAAYAVETVTYEGFEIEHSNGATVSFVQGGFTYRNGPEIATASSPHEFHSFTDDGFLVTAPSIHPDLQLEYADATYTYIDTATGERYDSLSDYLDAQQAEQDQQDQDNGDVDTIDAVPLMWGGYEVEADAQGDYVEVDGVQLRLMPDGTGGYYTDHNGYRLDEYEGSIYWTTPDGSNHPVEVTAEGFDVQHPDGIGTLSVKPPGFAYNSTNGSVGLGQQYEFQGFIDGGIAISATDVHEYLRLEFADGDLSWINTQTGEYYDSYSEFNQGLADTPTEQEENINDGEQADVDAETATWGGYELEQDSGTYSVTVDGVLLELTPAGNGQYYAEHQGYQLHEAAAGGLVWRGAPDGNDYGVDRVWSNGFQVDHPAGGHARFYDGHFDVQYPGGGSVSLYEPFGFYGFSGDGVVATGYQIHPDMHVVVENGNVTYVDRVSGETYESQSAFIEAHEQEAETIDVGSVFTDGEQGQSDGDLADNGDAEADNEPEPLEPAPPPPPPDSIGIDYAGGQPVLSMVYGGTPYQVPLSAQNGGYYVNVGGQAYEVHQEGGTYFIVADGNAYDLHGNPEIMSWPINNPAHGIDVSPYVETPEPAQPSNGQSPADTGMDTPPPDADDQSGDQDDTGVDEPDDDGYTFYNRYNEDGTPADGTDGMGGGGTDGMGGMDDQPPLEESLPPTGMEPDGADDMLAEAGPPEEQANE